MTELIGDGRKPLKVSQMPIEASKSVSGISRMMPAVEVWVNSSNSCAGTVVKAKAPPIRPAALALEGLACVAAARRQPRRTAVLLGAAESVRRRAGTPLAAQDRADVERATEAAAGALGALTFAELMEQGRRMSVLDATTYATSGGTGDI
jgi:hypothetical protein